MTLNLGLRYELNTVAQTYAGFASELNEDFTRIIPSANPADYPVPGFRLHEPNHGDIAPRLGATYRLTDKTVLRGGWGIYFNPNQMNTFTFLTNNPPLAPRFTYNNDTANPTLTLSTAHRRRGHHVAPGHHDAQPPSAERVEEPVELRRPARAVAVNGRRGPVPRVQDEEPGSQLLHQYAHARRRAHSGAPAESQLRQYPSDRERPHRQLRLARVRAAPPDERTGSR